ncbi:hypothetical protein BDP81DRAFT_424632 [Colletotrichum phormii]|uniref:Uncharacterized protein n=1 Tax=Colletotrichum phormii TaxID=359342 RepID=A0AAJ0EFK1_9PEZI|nr:uncharacterized protein BDP81DRAFT_424632 [Colletotrichum phormii]KAK1638287.1 hypothetical protein BDP81DRAFT_424632 [Colletotrichum phormii]
MALQPLAPGCSCTSKLTPTPPSKGTIETQVSQLPYPFPTTCGIRDWALKRGYGVCSHAIEFIDDRQARPTQYASASEGQSMECRRIKLAGESEKSGNTMSPCPSSFGSYANLPHPDPFPPVWTAVVTEAGRTQSQGGKGRSRRHSQRDVAMRTTARPACEALASTHQAVRYRYITGWAAMRQLAWNALS